MKGIRWKHFELRLKIIQMSFTLKSIVLIFGGLSLNLSIAASINFLIASLRWKITRNQILRRKEKLSMSNNPTPSVSTEKLAKISQYISENFFRVGKPLPQDDYFKSAAMTWAPIIDFIPLPMWDKCYADAVANLPEGEFVTAHRIKAAWPRVKQANTTNMFESGVHHEIRTCPRCGRQFSGLTQSTSDIIVDRRFAVIDSHC